MPSKNVTVFLPGGVVWEISWNVYRRARSMSGNSRFPVLGRCWTRTDDARPPEQRTEKPGDRGSDERSHDERVQQQAKPDNGPQLADRQQVAGEHLSLIHISEPTRPLYISYAVFCLKKIFF